MKNIDVAGQYMIGKDNNGNAKVVQTDENGKLILSGGGGGGGEVTVTNQAISKVAIKVPSDTANFAATRGLYIGSLGDVTVIIGGTTVRLANLSIGVWHPISVTAIKATGTTATNILVGY